MSHEDRTLTVIVALLLGAALFCSACKTTSESESHLTATVAETLNTDQQTDTHIVDAPDRTTTTVEEFAPLPEALAVREVGQPQNEGSGEQVHDFAGAHAATVAEHGPLVKRTVTVTEHGAVTIDKHVDAKSQEREDSVVTASAEEKHSTDFLHSPFALLGGLVALAGVAFAAWKLLKPRLL